MQRWFRRCPAAAPAAPSKALKSCLLLGDLVARQPRAGHLTEVAARVEASWRWRAEPAPEQAEQPCPMALGRRLVVDAGAQGKGEAVLDAGIPLEAVFGAGRLQRGLELGDDGGRRPLVDLGAREVGLA